MAIFDSPPLAVTPAKGSWTNYRESPRIRGRCGGSGDRWRDPAGGDDDQSTDVSFATPSASSSFMLRESVIAGSGNLKEGHTTSASSPPRAAAPLADMAETNNLPPPSTPVKYSKEIDQKESPKLLVLIDTRFSVSEEEETKDDKKKEGEESEEQSTVVGSAIVPAWEQPEPLSPILAVKPPFVATPAIFTPPSGGERSGGNEDPSAVEPLPGSPHLKAIPSTATTRDSDHDFLSPLRLAATVSNSTFNESQHNHQQQQQNLPTAMVDSRSFAAVVSGVSSCPDWVAIAEGEFTDCAGQAPDEIHTSSQGLLKSILGRHKWASEAKSSPRRTAGERKSVSFSEKSVFYFGRQQGWVSLPREGGNSLGKNLLVLNNY